VLQEKTVITKMPVETMTSGVKYRGVQWVEGNSCRVGWRRTIHGICITQRSAKLSAKDMCLPVLRVMMN
jgi:hypothetical protein